MGYIENFTPASAIIGGALIGLSANLMLLLNGRVAGISGILEGVIAFFGKDSRLQMGFVAGLLFAGLSLSWFYPEAFGGEIVMPVIWVVIAGVLVGFGTRLGSGCTSGHGVCGLSRFSTRSLVATMTFMAAGFALATIVHGLFAGAL